MADIIKKTVTIPLDAQNFLRRECPYCNREFKIKKEDHDILDISKEYWCPYCGQSADNNKWWTQEQINFINKIASNVLGDIINKELIKPLKQLNDHSSGIKVKLHEIERKNEIINPDINDMKVVYLPCCRKTIKIDETWNKTTHCFFCGFPHISKE